MGLAELAHEEVTFDGNFLFFNQLRGRGHPGLTLRHLLPQHLPLSPQMFGREGVWWRKSHL